ncbi:hypothetical protein EDD17DRAFT_1568680 [Pisolithus thermaeus]|nr:hypothetical protein EV401DRAFT_1922989 [Pisolithus croceorrhizus]KAI6163599.1 hypothetical protein EDD17DRAFT_1568680 [Pisolithus thermaeus]
MKVPDMRRRYTPEEKQQLVKNLDIEVEHRVRQLEEWLAAALTNFKLHQEGLISRIPKLVRSVKMGDFADKYDGDVQACLRGLQRERLGNTEELEIDRETRKRKWAAALEESEASGSGTGANDNEPPRALKSARVAVATPRKKGASSNPFSAANTPGTSRNPIRVQPSPSPHKLGKPPPFVPVRSTSPSKLTNGTTHHQPQRSRMPSSATFNPTMPTQAPTYPALRAPRRDESMLSVNGSPLANPYTLGLGWFSGSGEEDGGVNAASGSAPSKDKGISNEKATGKSKGLKRVNSIIIRRDPSVVLAGSSERSSLSLQSHSRTNSQSTTHSRSNSRTQPFVPESGPHPYMALSSTSASALVSLPTKDGHLLEFDPLNTSPSALDALVGITDSAKKEAREEMARLVKEAVRKWAIE